MIKHKHHEFPSDLFLMLETVGAEIHICMYKKGNTLLNFIFYCITIFIQLYNMFYMRLYFFFIVSTLVESPGQKKSVNFMQFLETDMNHKIIYSIMVPALKPEYVYRSYKVN